MANNHEAQPWVLTARWVLPVAGPPLPRGTVAVRGAHLEAVDPHGSRTSDLDLGNAAIVPGLVNAHTHLDLTGLRGLVPRTADFTAWLRAVIQHRRNLTPAAALADVRRGVQECLVYGTTLVGDVSSGGLSWPVLAESPLTAVVFHELIGLLRDGARQAWSEARRWLMSRPIHPAVRPGLSPHAPYSVRRSLFRTATARACKDGIPLMVHLSETAEEGQLLRERRGPFVDFLRDVGVYDSAGLASDVSEVLSLISRATPLLLAHGNYLDPRRPLPAGASVVYCPRTHAAFGHPPHPFRQMLSGGIRIALGTDSLASNPDLNVLAEARFLHGRYPDVPGEALLRMATLAGAEALGRSHETGSLSPGKWADLAVIPLPDADGQDPHALLWQSSLPPTAVLWRGQWVAGSARPPVP